MRSSGPMGSPRKAVAAPAQADEVEQGPEDEPIPDAVVQPVDQRPLTARSIGQRPQHGERGLEDAARERSGLHDLDGDRRVHFLPDPGHSEKERRPDLPHVALHRAQRLGEIDGVADGQRQMDREDLLGDMAQGQIGNHAVAFVDAVGGGDGVPGRVDVSIGQHDRLGAVGGPGGEDHQGGVFGREAPDAPLDQIRLPLLFPGAEGEHRLEGMYVALVDFDPLGVHDDDRPQLGKVGADREGLVELFLIFADEDRHVGFGQEVVDLVGGLVG